MRREVRARRWAACHVERPELLLMKVDDRVQIDGDVLFGGKAR